MKFWRRSGGGPKRPGTRLVTSLSECTEIELSNLNPNPYREWETIRFSMILMPSDGLCRAIWIACLRERLTQVPPSRGLIQRPKSSNAFSHPTPHTTPHTTASWATAPTPQDVSYTVVPRPKWRAPSAIFARGGGTIAGVASIVGAWVP